MKPLFAIIVSLFSLTMISGCIIVDHDYDDDYYCSSCGYSVPVFQPAPEKRYCIWNDSQASLECYYFNEDVNAGDDQPCDLCGFDDFDIPTFCLDDSYCGDQERCVNQVCMSLRDNKCYDNSDCESGLCLGDHCAPAQCFTDIECPNGVCNNGKCVSQVCDHDDCINSCVDGSCVDCNIDSDCDKGVCVNGSCRVVECRLDSDCRHGACVNGSCVSDECVVDSDCAGGLCIDGGCAKAQCSVNDDCDDGEMCSDGRCIACMGEDCDTSREIECVFASECESGLCVDGECMAAGTCVIDANCVDGQVCMDNKCVVRPECLSDDECGEGRICNAAYECEDDVQCRVDSDCGDRMICVMNTCVQCRLSCECPNEGDICLNGMCTNS